MSNRYQDPKDQAKASVSEQRAESPVELTVAAYYKDPVTGATYVHQDLQPAALPWAEQAHIGPVMTAPAFGDMESWAAYVKRFASGNVLATWNSLCLTAVLDYHDPSGEPGRCAWQATYPFTRSAEWNAWTRFANGAGVSPQAAIEFLENWQYTIVAPESASLLMLLRTLRATAGAKTEITVREDGTTDLSVDKSTTVRTSGGSLPPVISISIPVLEAEAETAAWGLDIRVRANVDDSGKLMLRCGILNEHKTIAAVLKERVDQASGLLGETLPILRAAG